MLHHQMMGGGLIMLHHQMMGGGLNNVTPSDDGGA